MKTFRKFAVTIPLLIMFFGVGSFTAPAQHVIDDSENPTYLFTMSATSGSFENDRLSLNGISLVIYFADRPYRVSGHMSLEDFMTAWEGGPGSFSEIPPNALLAIYGQSGDAHAVLTISEPEIGEGSISFRVDILDEDIPETFEHATLFIDGTGCWFCP